MSSKPQQMFCLPLICQSYYFSNKIHVKVLKEPFVRNLSNQRSAPCLQFRQVFCEKSCMHCFKCKLFDGSRVVRPPGKSPSYFTLSVKMTHVALLLQSIQCSITPSAEVCDEMDNQIRREALQLPSSEATVTNLWL